MPRYFFDAIKPSGLREQQSPRVLTEGGCDL